MRKSLCLPPICIPQVEIECDNTKYTHLKKITGPVIGIFGSSLEFQKKRGFPNRKIVMDLCFELGKWLALNNWVVITTACPGIPFWVADSTKKNKGITIGLSPYKNKAEHTKPKLSIPGYPTQQNSITVYTGVDFQYADILISSLVDIGIVIGGGLGSLIEASAIAEYEKPLICYPNIGGIAADIPSLFSKHFPRSRKLKLQVSTSNTGLFNQLTKIQNTIKYGNKQFAELYHQLGK